MRYLPVLCQLGRCSELVVSNSCNNCCSELAKTPVELVLSVTYNDVTVSETIAINSEADLQGNLASFTKEDFVFFTICYDTTKVVQNKIYTVTIDGTAYSYTNVNGSWDTVFTSLDSQIDASTNIDTIYDNNCIKISGAAITENTVITATDGILVAGPFNNSDEKFDNGVYKITSVFTFDDNTSDTMITYVPFVCQLESCIHTEISKLYKLVNCGCNSACIEEIMTAYGILQNILTFELNNSVDIATVEEQIAYLELFCKNKNCNCNG